MNITKTEMPIDLYITEDADGVEVIRWKYHVQVKKRLQRKIKPCAVYRMLFKCALAKRATWDRLIEE